MNLKTETVGRSLDGEWESSKTNQNHREEVDGQGPTGRIRHGGRARGRRHRRRHLCSHSGGGSAGRWGRLRRCGLDFTEDRPERGLLLRGALLQREELGGQEDGGGHSGEERPERIELGRRGRVRRPFFPYDGAA